MVEIGIMSREIVDSEEDSSRAHVVVKDRSKKLEGRVEVGEKLLPGIPNEITLDLIAPKLPWTSFYVLSSVSRGWQQAIQSRQVYDARVRTQSRQTLVVMNDFRIEVEWGLVLYLLRDWASYPKLPRVPGSPRDCVQRHQCIFLDGKFYVLGGYKVAESSASSAEVYMFDLVGQRQWRQCASMTQARRLFGAGVLNGKIYVLGGSGWYPGIINYASEVYDPESNAWSPIPPMKSLGLCERVMTWGEELLVHSNYYGQILAEVYNPLSNEWRSVEHSMDQNPLSNQWRTVDHLIEQKEIAFVVGLKLHKLSLNSRGSLDVSAMCANLWEPVHTFSFVELEARDATVFRVNSPLVVGDELLVGADWMLNEWMSNEENWNDEEKWSDENEGSCLLRIKGLGGQETDLPWRNSILSMSLEHTPKRFYNLCPIQL